jgi:hypothetical protein
MSQTPGSGEVERDPRWEWVLVRRFGMPDEWIKARCLHTEIIPVESVTGDVVAQLCQTCDTQFGAPRD